jgi:DNA polymerase-3 subunit delta'
MAFSPESALRYLRSSWDAGRLSHAYLIHGPDQPLLEDFATRFLDGLLGTEAGSLDTMAMGGAIRLVAPESKSRVIRIEQMRAMEHDLQMTDRRWPLKVAVVRDADRLNPQAQNAFLKTLEEPPARSLILLLTAAPEQLLETILSRCIRVSLFRSQPLPPDEWEEKLLGLLKRHYASGLEGLWPVQRLQKDFATLLSEIKDLCEEEQKAAFKEETQRFGKTTEGDWLKDREDHHEALARANYLQKRSLLLVRLVQWFGDIRRLQSDMPPLAFPGEADLITRLAATYDPRETMRRFQGMEQLYHDLNTNVNEGLALDVAFLESFA